MYPEDMWRPEMKETKPRPDPIPVDELLKMVGRPVFFVGTDYDGKVNICEWRVIDYAIVRKSGTVFLFTDARTEYKAGYFKAYREEVQPIDKDLIECDDADYAELISKIRRRFGNDEVAREEN